MINKAVFVLTCAALTWTASGCSSEAPLPSLVNAIVVEKCQQCHGDPLAFGAPMQLVSWEDTQRSTPSNSGRTVWQQMRLRIHDADLPMPPMGLPALTVDEIATLDAWFAQDAPAGD